MDLAQKQLARAQIINSVYDAVDGSEILLVQVQPIVEALGLSADYAADTLRYLEGEGLLEGFWSLGTPLPQAVQLTHRGVVEVEEARTQPALPTQHFPAYNTFNVVNIGGDMVGSAIQQGSPGAQQNVNTAGVDAIRELTVFLRDRLDELNLSPEERDEVTAGIEALEGQLRLPTPKRSILTACVGELRAVLSGVTTSIAAGEVMHLLSEIRF